MIKEENRETGQTTLVFDKKEIKNIKTAAALAGTLWILPIACLLYTSDAADE